jgi:archaellum component FlaF (FlaF/FlaG flagellin family)
MKNLLKSVVIASTLIFALPTYADQKSDNALLTDCKDSITESIEGVSNVKVATIRSRRGVFTAKLRVTANDENSIMECVSEDSVTIAITCVSGSACDTSTIVAQ